MNKLDKILIYYNMSRNISVISATPTFGTLRQNLSQSDYLTRKKGLKSFCQNPTVCNNNNIYRSYNDINTYNWGKYTKSLNDCTQIPVNKSSMVLNKYSVMDLNGACIIIAGSPCTNVGCINNCPPIGLVNDGMTPFYAAYTIDPNGALFGTNQCGSLNYTHYLRFSNYGPNFINYNKIT